MIALVSHRAPMLARLRMAFGQVRATDLVSFPSVDAFLEADAPAAAVVLDLMSVREDTLVECAAWQRVHPGAQFYGVFGGDGGPQEARTLIDFVAALDGHMVHVRELGHPEYIRELVTQLFQGVAQLHANMRERFLEAVQRTGRPLQSERPILMFLELAPRNPSVGVVAAQAAANRAALNRKLRQARTLHASDLLVLMKILWWVYLRDAGWTPAAIAEFLHTSPRQWRKHIGDHFGLSNRVLEHLPASVMFDWVAQLCVEPFATPPSPRVLVDALVTCAERLRQHLNHAALVVLQDLAAVPVRTRARNQKTCSK